MSDTSKNPGSERLGKEPVLRLLIKLSAPAIMGMAIQACYNVVDSIFIGRLSKEALSALSLAFPLQMVLIAVAVGTGAGATSLISRLLGQGESEKASNTAEHVLLLGLFFGIVAALTGLFFSRRLILFFTTEPLLVEYATEYIRIIMLGSVMMFAPMVSNSILRGEGNTFVPMLTMLIGALLNILLDPFFIFGIGPFPRLEVAGAAWATVISRIISGTFVLIILFGPKNEIKLRFSLFRFQPEIFKGIYRVGLPSMMMQLLASVMLAGGNKILEQYDLVAIAVMGVFFRLQSFIFMPVFGLGQGLMPLTGYNYGAKNYHRLKRIIAYGLAGGFLFTFTGFLIFQIFPRQLLLLFNNDPHMLEIGIVAMRRISLGFLVVGVALSSAIILQALGYGLPSLIVSIGRTILVLLPAMYILGRVFGLDAIWYAFPLAEGLSFLVGMIWLALILRKVFSRQ